jgi:ribosomal protein S18 acetylase RimI-like enzyme
MERTIRALTAEDEDWVVAFIDRRWGAPFVVAHGKLYYPHTLPGFVAEVGGEVAGLITYHVEGDAWEIVTIDSEEPGVGIGSDLIYALRQAAKEAGARRLWLITTNDNLNALRFYQKRGFALVAVHRNAVERSRQLKPSIPLVGEDGIPLRDELELEMRLA